MTAVTENHIMCFDLGVLLINVYPFVFRSKIIISKIKYYFETTKEFYEYNIATFENSAIPLKLIKLIM